MKETVIFESNAQIGKHTICHHRKPIDISGASRFEAIFTDETMNDAIEGLPWFLEKISFAKSTIFYVNGIKDMNRLSRKWGIGNQEETKRLGHDKITMPEFTMFTSLVIEGIGSALDLPISNITFSEKVTTTAFVNLTTEIDWQLSILNIMPQIFPSFSSSQQLSY